MKNLIYLITIFAATMLFSCTKDVSVDLPPYEKQVVVEGKIEENGFPLVILTRSQGYYDPINADVFSNLFVKDAEVRVVVNGKDTVMLDKYCTDALSDSLKEVAAQLLNLPPGSGISICVYTSFNTLLKGKAGNTYKLLVKADGKDITSTTAISEAVPLDSLYWKVDGKLDSLGFLYAKFKDPVNQKNAYRWFAQRINTYPYGPYAGEQKDNDFVAPFGSVFNDDFVNGQVIEFAYNRGHISGSEKDDDEGEERGYFKRGDEVVVKFTTIDPGVYKYFESYYNSLSNSGSPFASPANIKSNVSGGVGVWAGYGVFLDTLVVK